MLHSANIWSYFPLVREIVIFGDITYNGDCHKQNVLDKMNKLMYTMTQLVYKHKRSPKFY